MDLNLYTPNVSVLNVFYIVNDDSLMQSPVWGGYEMCTTVLFILA